MSSIPLPLKMLIAGGAFAGLTLLACGGDDGGKGSSDDDDTSVEKSDAGKKDGGSKDAGKKDAAAAIPHAVEGEDCTGLGGMCDDDACDKAPCFAKCESGSYGACNTISNLIPDSGAGLGNILGDGGNVKVSDAGVSFTPPGSDAAVNIPATECPSGYECNNIGALIGVPLNFCTAPGAFTPPTCTSTKDCTDLGFKLATCGMIPVLGGMGCLTSCK